MKSVLKVVAVSDKTSKAGKKFFITHVLLEDGTEAEFFGKGVKVGEEVQCFYDPKYDKIKVFKRLA